MIWLLISVATVAGAIGVLLGMIIGAAVMMFTSHLLAGARSARRSEAEPDWGYTHG